MKLIIFSLLLTMMGLFVTNGAWVGVETDGMVVVGKTSSSLGVFLTYASSKAILKTNS